MKLHSLFFRTSLFVFFMLLFLGAPRAGAQSNAQTASAVQTPAVPTRITQPIDETQLVRLQGNVHPLARPEFDQGPVADSMPVKRAVLLLQRSPEQEAALQQLLADQQLNDSPNFHKWLTPQQFGVQFGPADADVQAVTQWLTGHGFHDAKVGPGRTTIEFSGTVGQVRNTFHTEIHQFNVNGRMHLANVSDPQIPAALTPVVANVLGLHDFRPKSLLHRVANFNKRIVGKEVTFTCGPSGSSFPCFGVAPADFAKIYNVPATVGTNPAGQGVPIAIVQDSNINLSDVQQYRSAFNLTGGAVNVILNGPDPGIQDPTTITGDETEADLDVELAGGVAPGATIDLVVSEDPLTNTLGVFGTDLSAIYIIDNNVAPIMSESFGSCETATNGVEPFYAALWEQAAAQGITVVVATGDAGSDVCDALGTANDFSTTGLSISGIASTPFNVALGGTDFQNGPTPSTYWSSPGTPTESAKSYIPESTWNSSCAAGATSSNLNTCTAAIISSNASSLSDIEGGSGGQSSVTANTKPSWQVGITPTNDRRDIPDISLYSAVNTNNNTFYMICEADSPQQKGGACDPGTATFTGIGGTSAAAPAFAGIMAMIVQQQGGEPAGRQGNANFVLYQLFNKNKATSTLVCPSDAAHVSTTTCIFYDVVTGNNSVACAGGTTNCSNTSGAANQYGVLVDPANNTTPAFTAVAGYDKATGLGSVNVANLLKAWTSATFTADTPKITASPSTAIAHGTNASFTVQVSTASGTPSGNISLIATPPSPAAPVAIGTDINGNPLALSGGSLTFQTKELPGGASYPVVAQYGGDGTFAPGTSSAVNVTVNKESSVTTASLLTFDASTRLFDLAAPNPVVYGTTPYIMRVDVTNSGGLSNACSSAFPAILPCPTGTITETIDGGQPLNDFPNSQTGVATNTAPLNSLGFLEDQPIDLPGGSHTIMASYAGDNSYSASTSNTLSLTVNPAPTNTTVGANPTSGVTTTTAVTLTASIATTSGGNGPTGSVTFSAGGSTLGTAQVVPMNASNPNAVNLLPASGTATLTHTFSTPGTYTVSASFTTGDTNYTGSASSGAGNATVAVAAGTTTTTTTLTASPMTLPAGGGSVMLTAMVMGTGSGASPTGTVQFMNGTTALSTAQTCSAVSGATSPTCKATLTATLSFMAPPTPMGPRRIPTLRIPWILLIGFALLLLLFLNWNRVPAPYRRAYAYVGFLLLAALVAGFAAACGSGYGGGGGGVHYDTITAVYSGDATYAGSTSSAVTITVQ